MSAGKEGLGHSAVGAPGVLEGQRQPVRPKTCNMPIRLFFESYSQIGGLNEIFQLTRKPSLMRGEKRAHGGLG